MNYFYLGHVYINVFSKLMNRFEITSISKSRFTSAEMIGPKIII